ncbi:hypothetical protein P3H15_52070 [Rhodococcus sp. T2V]|uniref:hypothetical protein n=1 Tax=Rhodococcus sp. T2V TaxID=3034164 RepID=UPI0023E2BF5D|nr:hypothetical protein [Rhodococcus sp. T2V]MDF3313444.1 hypothetical protein [Rhodococcus sp. T2V]
MIPKSRRRRGELLPEARHCRHVITHVRVIAPTTADPPTRPRMSVPCRNSMERWISVELQYPAAANGFRVAMRARCQERVDDQGQGHRVTDRWGLYLAGGGPIIALLALLVPKERPTTAT